MRNREKPVRARALGARPGGVEPPASGSEGRKAEPRLMAEGAQRLPIWHHLLISAQALWARFRSRIYTPIYTYGPVWRPPGWLSWALRRVLLAGPVRW